MAQLEELEMNAYPAELSSDVKDLVDKYRAIFGWDVPEVDVAAADRLIVKALRDALDDIAQKRAPTGA